MRAVRMCGLMHISVLEWCDSTRGSVLVRHAWTVLCGRCLTQLQVAALPMLGRENVTFDVSSGSKTNRKPSVRRVTR